MTYIQIIGDYQNVGINAYLEIAEEVIVPLNFGISDIRDLSSKTGAFSKSIKVAGTKNNNLVLGHLFDVNTVTGVFNINTKQQCLIIQDGNTVLDNAILQLVSVDKVSNGMNDDEDIVYTVTVKDTVGELFTNIGNAFLSDIDLSNFNHLYSSANVVASYANTYVDGYKYILPYTNDASYSLIEMKPAVYVWEYFNRIFAMAGYAWEWDEAIDNHFDKLLIPYNGGAITDTAIEEAALIVEATKTVSQTFNEVSHPVGSVANINLASSPTLITIPNEITDPNGDYSGSTYTVPAIASNNFGVDYTMEIEYEIIVDNLSGATAYLETFNAGITNGYGVGIIPLIYIKKAGYGNYDQLYLFQNELNNSKYLLDNTSYANGATVAHTGTVTINKTIYGVDLAGGALTTGFFATVIGRNTSNNYADYRFYNTAGGSGSSGLVDVQIRFKIVSINLTIQPQVDAISYNTPIIFNRYIPSQIKQSDFLKSIFTMYNLYCTPDSDDPKKIILKIRDDFYDGGEVKDWSDKLAKDEVSTINFLPELTSKRLTLTYKEDSDDFNKGYVQNVNEIYGQVQYTFDNEYIKNDDTKQLIFGASPFIRTSFNATVTALNGAEPKTLPRVLYDGGEIDCGYYQIIDYGTTGTSINTYPLTTHFDKEINPTFDLNFGICDYYFDKTYNSPTHNNLANLFWRRTMSQINSGKLYAVNLWLTSFDIQSLKLNDKIYLDRSYWNINKIIDYNANSKQLTRVELISIDDDLTLPQFPLKVPNIPVEVNIEVTKAIAGLSKNIGEALNNNATKSHVLISGKNVTVSNFVKNAVIVGDNITVSEDGVHTENLFVTGKLNGTDIVEIGQNFANTDLTLTGNRTHLLDGNSLNLLGGQVAIDELLSLTGLSVYANNAAAAAVLNTGDVYQTSTGELRIVV